MGTVAAPPRLNLAAIEAALRGAQRSLDAMSGRRDAMSDPVIANMLAGYALVGALVADHVNVFAMGNLKHVLELNTVVLCGTSMERRAAYAPHIAASERRFYDERQAGIEDVVEWYARHADRSVRMRAAGIYVRVLSTPQLFIEGNHRTGTLMMSYLLLRDGQPPFVLSAENAAAYFGLSAVIRASARRGPAAFLRQLVYRRRLAGLLALPGRRHYLTV